MTATVDLPQWATAQPLFTNCGDACGSYNQQDFLLVADSGGGPSAMPFTTNREGTLTKVLVPLLLESGSPAKMILHLLHPATFFGGPGKPMATLIQVGTISGKKWKVIEYKPRKPIKLVAGATYFLCATARPNTDTVVAWAKNVTGDHDSLYVNLSGSSCNSTDWAMWQNPTTTAYAVF